MHTLFKRGLAALTLSAVFSLPALATNPISSPDTMILGDSIFALSGDIHEKPGSGPDENIDPTPARAAS
ncbi:hypothetical protein ULF88_18655 [Halopseudomonas pachastrellae]|nr:hypothetical protein [Halopseudomonas pachastrellae]